MRLCDTAADTNTTVAFIGGAGFLYLDEEHTVQLADSPDFPPEHKPVADAHAKTPKYLHPCNHAQWLYVDPPADFLADAPFTGDYVITGEDGTGTIGYTGYAVAFIDANAAGTFNQQQISARNR